ncbi:pak-box p21-rho-binding protein [Colletotrichum tabaci]|uniref:Pak-box p21-rho-binding protein n=1 Tax=Colletotrichum tabaci TaxID=1209068 RepID=A0AAV9SZY4_9PEZI
MWATAPLPYYSAYKPNRRKERASTGNNKDSSPPSPSVHSRQQPPPPLPLLSTQFHPDNITDLLEPALDGPPSPERIRALSKQMKRASAADKHKSHATTSSGSSSSLRSLNSDRSWEHTLETITISRRSSGRSTSSTMPSSRDRPESVQLFGKTIFNRRARMKRESSNQTPSGTSLHPGELVLDGPTSTNKDHFIPSIFGRRRTLRQDDLGDDPALARKLQISGPYNFQHVTHTKRDHLPDLQRGSRAELVSEFSAIRAGQRPTTGQPRGFDVEDLHFANFSSEALHTLQDGAAAAAASSGETSAADLSLNRPPTISRHTGPPSAPRRMIKHTRSQEQLRSSPPRPAPPRPPRSPIREEPMSPTLPGSPVPPPRSSSRIAKHFTVSQESVATADSGAPQRPQTSNGIQNPGFLEAVTGGIEPMATAQETTSSGGGLEVLTDPRFSHAITTPDDAAWPLTASTNFSYEMALPDVPEEEEQYVSTGRSRGSLVSTRSSLRGSQSVPVLRQLAQTQDDPERPPSGASDTLGGSLDVLATQKAPREVQGAESDTAEAPRRASWEDDIDYCYEHEVEADCDYAWDRPSLDLVRESFVLTNFDTDNFFVAPLSAGLMPAPSGQHMDNMPALSPASQTSMSGHEAITPTVTTTLPVKSNFSHPRKETNYRGTSHLHVRTASHASSFKESHGFNLSPSLLIPGDYRQQMLAESDTDSYPVEISRHNSDHFSFDEEPVLTMETPGLFARDRASTSTTGSNSSSQTSSTGARHASTNSTWTALTRYTGSTTFEGWNPKFEGSDHSRSFSADDFPELALGSPRGLKSTMTPLPESDEVLTMSRSTGDMRAVSGRLDASQSQENLPLYKTKEPVNQHRRQRAQTLSAPPPPRQYALFPPIYSGSRI